MMTGVTENNICSASKGFISIVIPHKFPLMLGRLDDFSHIIIFITTTKY